MASVAEERATLTQLLAERGVSNPETIVAGVDDEELDGAFGALSMYDDMDHAGRNVGPGLLVNKIREGGLPAYKRPHERTSVEGAGPSAELLKSIRGVLGSPDGFTRAAAREFYADTARRLNTPVDALIDSAMTARWFQTPAHPGSIANLSDPEADAAAVAVRYELWVGGHCEGKADLECTPRAEESEHEWACRFWHWQDPEKGFAEAVEAVRAHQAKAYRRKEPEQQRTLPPGEPEPVTVSAGEALDYDPDEEF